MNTNLAAFEQDRIERLTPHVKTLADLTQDEFYAELDAIWEGRATRLVHCYLCFLEETGKPDFSQRGDRGPLRGVARTFTGGGSDPTEVLVLVPCGHEII
jgi:hypothetical protein